MGGTLTIEDHFYRDTTSCFPQIIYGSNYPMWVVDTTAKALERAKKLIDLGIVAPDISVARFLELLEALK